MKKLLLLIAGNLITLLLLLLMLEGVLFWFLSYPSSPAVRGAARIYHLMFERANPMYLDECAEHDGRVTYRLKPVECRFSSREFSTSIRGNSMGLRDDEASLIGPEIVVLGDSYAFGWGVEQAEAFPTLLEDKLGKKVLAVALPSFGTVRALRMLKRMDRSKVTDVIIQYASNDSEENRSYISAKNRLPIMSKDSYRDYGRRYASDVRAYYPGKLIRRFLPILWDHLQRRDDPNVGRYGPPRDVAKEAKQFIHVLRYSPLSFKGLRVWVTELSTYGQNDPEFLKAVEAEYAALSDEDKLDLGDLHTVDVSAGLLPEQNFVYDDHLTPAGHKHVANVLAQAVQR